MSRVSFSMVNEQLNKMRQEGVAFDLDKFLSPIDLPDEVLARLKWLNNSIWWSDIKNNRCHLTVRKGSDVEFVKRVWADTDFMHSFHRFAGVLPESDQAVRELLNTEWSSTFKTVIKFTQHSLFTYSSHHNGASFRLPCQSPFCSEQLLVL